MKTWNVVQSLLAVILPLASDMRNLFLSHAGG